MSTDQQQPPTRAEVEARLDDHDRCWAEWRECPDGRGHHRTIRRAWANAECRVHIHAIRDLRWLLDQLDAANAQTASVSEALTNANAAAERIAKARDAAEAESARLRTQKDGAYTERDRLVAALSKLFPAHLERHPDSDTTWDDDWRWIVFIDLPTGQASWHIHDSELAWFDHLPHVTGNSWDGHTTEEKYERVAALAGAAIGSGVQVNAGACPIAAVIDELERVQRDYRNEWDLTPEQIAADEAMISRARAWLTAASASGGDG